MGDETPRVTAVRDSIFHTNAIRCKYNVALHQEDILWCAFTIVREFCLGFSPRNDLEKDLYVCVFIHAHE